MHLSIDIPNETLLKKIVKILEVFKDDGVKVLKRDSDISKPDEEWDDKYIEKHWKEILMGCKSDPDYYKSEEYYEDRGNFLMEKYK